MQLFVMFIEGVAVINDPGRMITVYLISLGIWGGLATGVYALAMAFGFDLGFAACVAVMAIVNLGLIIPSSPGFIGTFQFFCVAALGLFGVEQSSALSFSVIYHLSQWLPTTVLGYYFLNRENIKLHRLSRLQAAAPEESKSDTRDPEPSHQGKFRPHDLKASHEGNSRSREPEPSQEDKTRSRNPEPSGVT
jgi:hypothetical protein